MYFLYKLFFSLDSLQRSLADYSPWGRKTVGHNLVTKEQPNKPQTTSPTHRGKNTQNSIIKIHCINKDLFLI